MARLADALGARWWVDRSGQTVAGVVLGGVGADDGGDDVA